MARGVKAKLRPKASRKTVKYIITMKISVLGKSANFQER
jgi:hypothetical protein